MLISAAFEAAYATELPIAQVPAIEATLTTAPCPASRSAGIAARTIWNAPVTFTAKIRAKSTASRPARFACATNVLTPALLTR